MSRSERLDLQGWAILVVDDHPPTRQLLVDMLSAQKATVEAAENGQAGLRCMREQKFDVALIDVHMDDMGGIALLQEAQSAGLARNYVMMSGEATVPDAVEATRLGAKDFLLKPFGLDEVNETLGRIDPPAGAVKPPPRSATAWRDQYAPEIVGQDPALLELFFILERVARSDITVLITGESGSGKELVARAIHRGSPRKAAEFVPTNCGAITESLSESKLFGHVRGAFTGAHRDQAGLFEKAHKGTLFLDEIGEMSHDVQVKLLRVLQEHKIERVGDTRSREVDVRVLSATHRDLAQLVGRGGFRDDLRWRLNTVQVHLPPLRDRPGDIGLLASHFLEVESETQAKALGAEDPAAHRKFFSEAALSVLERQPWPGNVRELEGLVKRVHLYHDSNDAQIGVGSIEAGLRIVDDARHPTPDSTRSDAAKRRDQGRASRGNREGDHRRDGYSAHDGESAQHDHGSAGAIPNEHPLDPGIDPRSISELRGDDRHISSGARTNTPAPPELPPPPTPPVAAHYPPAPVRTASNPGYDEQERGGFTTNYPTSHGPSPLSTGPGHGPDYRPNHGSGHRPNPDYGDGGYPPAHSRGYPPPPVADGYPATNPHDASGYGSSGAPPLGGQPGYHQGADESVSGRSGIDYRGQGSGHGFGDQNRAPDGFDEPSKPNFSNGRDSDFSGRPRNEFAPEHGTEQGVTQYDGASSAYYAAPFSGGGDHTRATAQLHPSPPHHTGYPPQRHSEAGLHSGDGHPGLDPSAPPSASPSLGLPSHGEGMVPPGLRGPRDTHISNIEHGGLGRTPPSDVNDSHLEGGHAQSENSKISPQGLILLELASQINSTVQSFVRRVAHGPLPTHDESRAFAEAIEQRVESLVGNRLNLPDSGIKLKNVTASFEKLMIDQAIARAGHNNAEAARLLGMKRTTLLGRLKRKEPDDCDGNDAPD